MIWVALVQIMACRLFSLGEMSQLIEAEWRIHASLNWVIIGSDNGLSPVRRQAIIWTNTGILLIGPLGTNFSEILSEIHTFSFKKMRLKMSSGKWRPFCLGLNVLKSCNDLTQWVSEYLFSNSRTGWSLVLQMVCHMLVTKSLLEPTLAY